MKKVLIVLLVLSMLFCLSACSGDGGGTPNDGVANKTPEDSTGSTTKEYKKYPSGTDIEFMEFGPLVPNEVYTTTAEENGLAGEVYMLMGSIEDYFVDGNYAYIRLDTVTNGDVVITDPVEMVKASSMAETLGDIDYVKLRTYYPLPEKGEFVTIFGEYQGFSKKFECANFIYASEDYLLEALLNSVIETTETPTTGTVEHPKEDVTLYEDDSVKITFKKAEKSKYGSDRAELYFYAENKTDGTLLIQADAVSINGYSFCSLTMSDNVTAHSIGTINLSVQEFDFDLVDINVIRSIGGQFRIIDDSTRDSYKATFTNVMLDGSGAGTKPNDFECVNTLYSDDSCTIYHRGIIRNPYSDDRAELYLYVENKTGGTLLIQADAVSVNGYGYSRLVMSDYVLSNTIGIVNLSIQEIDFSDVDISKIEKLGGQLRIINDETRDSHKAIFTDVALS